MKLVASISTLILTVFATDIDYRLQDGASQIASIFLSDSSFNSAVFNHGCWCGKLSSLPSVGLGGKAIDEMDQICKNWNKARACTRVEGSNCYGQANDAMYEIQPAGSGYNCVDTDACLLETCTIDSNYAAQLETWWQNNQGSFNTATDINSNPTCEFGQRTGLYCPNADICYESNYNPESNDFVLGSNQETLSGYTMLSSAWFNTETGVAWLNKHYRAFGVYPGMMTGLTTDAAICTSDGAAIKFSNGNWMRLSEPGADVNVAILCGHLQTNCYNNNQYILNYDAFFLGCGNTDCSPANFDWATARFSGEWTTGETMAAIHVNSDLFIRHSECLANGFRSTIGNGVETGDGETNSTGN